MKDITFSADKSLIEAARERAKRENTTLNVQFRLWLAEYSRKPDRVAAYDEAIRALRGKVVVGRKLTREEMNER